MRQSSALVVVSLLALLTGCGGGGGGSNPPPPPPPPPVDTTPDAFSFGAQTGISLSAVTPSNEITIAGINAAAAVTITGGEYSISGGTFTSVAGQVVNGQRLQVRVTASNQFSTSASAVLTVGGVSATFSATTLAADPVPDAFAIPRTAGATRDAMISSGSITIAGTNTSSPVTIENGEYSIAGGAFTSAAGSINPGQSFVVRARAGTSYSKVTRARITIGTVSAEFEVTSELPNYVPDSVAYDGQDVVYLLNNPNRLVFRWSISEARYLDAYQIGLGGVGPTLIAHSNPQHRLYLGYDSGAIRYLDVNAATPVETAFASMTGAVTSLSGAGNFVITQVGQYNYSGGYVLNSSGVTTANGGYYYGYSRETAWDPVTSRVYYTRDGISPNDLHFDVINQTTGQVSSQGETPYHGSYNIQSPIRVSVDGQYVLMGSGDIYRQPTLNWSGSLGSQVTDARWFTNGSLVTLRTVGTQTTLRRLGATNLGVLEQLTYTGQALRVVGTDARMAVLVVNNNAVQIHTYVPNDDSDGDGVLNTADAFPLDRAASVDTDRDGYPDAWNTGRTQADSTTGLTLDAFPADSACYLASHGVGGVCNYGATIPNYVPDQVIQNGDVVYLLSSTNRRVYRWSISTGAYLNPYVVGINQGFSTIAPVKMAYSSAHNRVYLGYETGAIRYIDVAAASPVETPFANTALAVNGLAAVGNYVLAQDHSGAWATHYVISNAGTITDSQEWNYYSREYAWDPNTSRVYFFRDDTSPNDLHFEVIDQGTGLISSEGESPYHGSYSIQPPIRVSANGQHILLGSGDIYAQNGLTWSGSLGAQVADARWLANGSLVTLTTANNQTTLRRLGASNLGVLEQLSYTGQALRVVGSDSAMTVLVINNGTVQFVSYVPNDDSDGDGVLNTVDAFPLDRAASVDTDRDGYPDAWNPGRTQADSTTGLVLDAFPLDSACYLASHGIGGVCNYGATIPNYVPDQVAQHGDVVYLLSSANRRVYRWSISTGAYLNPYIVGINQGFSTIAPTKMTFSSAHNRVYLGYQTGAIRYIDVNATSPVEVPFANTALAVNGLASVGNYVLAQDYSGAWATHYVINNAGVITDSNEWNYYSAEYTWDPVHSRVYFFRDHSPGDLHYEVIDQATGQITSSGETPYHGTYNFGGVIRVSANGQFILLGGGDLFTQATMNWTGTLGAPVDDARWFANGSLVTLTTSNNQTLLRRLGSTNLAVLEQLTFNGQALRVLGTDAAMVVLVINNGTVAFHNYVPNDDSDGDGVSNALDAFPLDRAASVDTDHDGYPDAWNAGRSQADSTTGLTLDAFPQDAACWLSSHGIGGVCNYGATIPNYTPDQVVQQGDVVYLLSSANRRVYRWSISNAAYLNPYVVGLNQGFSTVAPVAMDYSATHQRLYLGYATGPIRYIDVNAATPTEVAFANPATALTGLTSAGNFLVAHTGGNYGNNSTFVINGSGVTTDDSSGYYDAGDHTFDPVTSRLYHVTNGYSSYALYYEVIDQVSGLITSSGNSNYNSSLVTLPPARVSVDGQHIVVGGGDLYAQNGLTWEGSVGGTIADARWFANGSLATLTTIGNQTTLRRLSATNLTVLEQRTFAGQALRVVGSDTSMVVLVGNNGTVEFHPYVPNNDSDGDGVANTADAFPLDRAASVDTDGDGYPDAWNAGRTQADSTTGLTLDAFPLDSACYLASHGSGGVCNYGATIPNYTPDEIAQHGDVVYLLSSSNRRVYRRSISSGNYLNPYVVGINQGFSNAAPTAMAFSSSQQRLYLGYGTGAIRYIDVTAPSPVETAFANMPAGVTTLQAAGNFLAVQAGSGRVVNASTGVITDDGGYYYGYSQETAFDPVTSRVYFTRDGLSPNDLHYDVIDQVTGLVTSSDETPYHGSYSIMPPIRVSASGQYVLMGSGDIYNQNGLTWSGSLGAQIVDGKWLTNGSLVTLATASNQTTLRRMSGTNLAVVEQLSYTGQALRVVGSDTAMVVIVLNNGTVQFHSYVPNDDSDADGVQNTQDAFPLDPAASLDTDRDGFPDAWNAGHSQATSTTGLTLDAFPQDSACWLSSHGVGGVCNYGATIPNYIPDQVVSQGNIVYLLSSANRRVYRWSMVTGAYLNPYIVGINQGFSTIAPTDIAYSPSHQRLYLGYDSGAIRYIDVNAASPVETPYANVATAVGGLASVGNYMLVQDYSGAWATHYVINAAGIITDQAEWNHHSPDYAWDPLTSRVYWFSMWSPSDLNYEVIDQVSGQITAQGESPYHGDYSIIPPIRVSPNSQHILLGSGDIYNQSGLTWAASLGKQVKDAHWKDNLLIDVDTTDRVEIRDANTRAVLAFYQYLGQPLRVVFGTSEAYLVHVMNGTTAFVRMPFYDADADAMPRWWEQLYGLNDSNAADAAGDLDGDGVDNVAEYVHRSNPLVNDTDADGLFDAQEISTYQTDPSRADTDGDGLTDYAEVVTHHSDPRDTDSDNDGYTDLDEVLYGGNPNDPSGLPVPLSSYSQTFEGSPNLSAWAQPSTSNAPWALATGTAHAGTQSYRSGTIGNSQNSAVRFRGFFTAGQLAFWARVDSEIWDRLYVFIDGVQVYSVSSSLQWTSHTVPVALGIHEIEWRYQKDLSGSNGADAAWIDDVVFTGQ